MNLQDLVHPEILLHLRFLMNQMNLMFLMNH
jgi:hypothetical protein